MTIFNRKEEDEVRVPELEVRGDEVTVQHQNEREEQPQEKKYKLPKTKWFC